MAKSSYFVLRREEAQRMHEAALSVLADIGMRVNGDAALKLIREAGCQVDNRTRIAKIPESLVNEAIKSAPKELVLASRDGNRDIAAPAVNTPAICTDGFAVDLVDSETGADTLMTACPFCVQTLSDVARAVGSQLKVAELAVFLAEIAEKGSGPR